MEALSGLSRTELLYAVPYISRSFRWHPLYSRRDDISRVSMSYSYYEKVSESVLDLFFVGEKVIDIPC